MVKSIVSLPKSYSWHGCNTYSDAPVSTHYSFGSANYAIIVRMNIKAWWSFQKSMGWVNISFGKGLVPTWNSY